MVLSFSIQDLVIPSQAWEASRYESCLMYVEFISEITFVYFFSSVCPLTFDNTKHVAKSCRNEITNQTACCNAMESYVSHLQKQRLITNLQALDCAAILGTKLQKSNITTDVYKLCHLSLKDFSLQGQSLNLFLTISISA